MCLCQGLSGGLGLLKRLLFLENLSLEAVLAVLSHQVILKETENVLWEKIGDGMRKKQ